jgi:hypothetical protein
MRKIYDLLPDGREAAIPARDLARIAGLSSTRSLQLQIERERAGGAVILSRSDGGYYRSSDPEELRRFIRTLDARSRNTAKAMRSAQAALDALTGQDRVKGWWADG